jgi:prophage antirepressor-like protein
MQTAQVIPFRFEAREVRTLLIVDQPWFVANDVSAALQYSEASAMTRHLDEDEKGLSIVQTPGGEQEMLVINESGLYSAILRSRKSEAKRFKKWVTAEVLPAIRKHGRYEDTHNKMATLVDELIGMSEVNVIKGLIRGKANVVPIDKRRSFQQSMHNRLHTRFNVPRIELIPAAQFEAACNFVAAYALEGEWLPQEEKTLGAFVLNEYQAQELCHLLHYTDWVKFRWDQCISEAVKAMNPKFHSQTWEFFTEASHSAKRLEKSMPELLTFVHGRTGGRGMRPHECIAKGHPVGHPAD